MRVEINAGGLGAGIAVAEYQLNMSGFISDAESVISSFKAVSNKVYDLSGGVGSLQDAVDDLSARIREEEERKEAAVAVQRKANDFLELAIRVDKQVASLVNKNKDEFYQTNPWLKPAVTVDDTPWYEDAWKWLCGKGEQIAEGLKTAWEWTKDAAKKAWDGLVTFYNEHKKIIDTVLIVVGAIGAIVAVVASGGVALVPLLGALGVSTSAAIAISTAVAVVAVVSTVASSVLNVVDIWAEIDNPTFNAWQKGLNIVSAVSNITYSIGNLYNSVKHIDPTDYIANNPPATAPPSGSAATTTFDDGVSIAKDPFNDQKYFVKGDHYDEYVDFWEDGMKNYSYTPAENPQIQNISANDIEGVFLNQNEVSNPSIFWDKRYTKAEYLDYVANGGISNNPVEVAKVNDSFYYFTGEGRHRIIAAQIQKIDIPVIIKGFYTTK